jgi:hypothetical protein
VVVRLHDGHLAAAAVALLAADRGGQLDLEGRLLLERLLETGARGAARLEVVDRLVDGNGHLGDGIHEGSSRVGRGGQRVKMERRKKATLAGRSARRRMK